MKWNGPRVVFIFQTKPTRNDLTSASLCVSIFNSGVDQKEPRQPPDMDADPTERDRRARSLKHARHFVGFPLLRWPLVAGGAGRVIS